MIKIKTLLQKVSILVGMCLLLGIISAQAANLTVTNTNDDGFGSLRQAIIDATINAEENTIAFNIPTTDPGYSAAENRFTIALTTSLPDIPLAPMTISNDQPQALTVKGNDSFRIFLLSNSAVLTINKLTISNGSTDSSGLNGSSKLQKSLGIDTNGLGGGIYMSDSSTLTLNECVVSDNFAVSGGAVYIQNSGTLNISASTISNNTALASGGAIFNNISGTINVSDTTINGNSALDGGGIYNNTTGTINADTSTFDGNNAGGSGGGIYNTATMTLTNNTVSSNTAGSGGGGIYNNFVATLNNNLVALNTAPDGNDLLGRESLGNGYSGTYNLIGNADGSEGLSGAPNQSGSTAEPILPLLGPLQNNGGSTLTRALLPGSPAIDKGNSATIIYDQRGEARPYDNMLILNTGNGADVGAYEAHLSPTSAEVSIGGRVLISNGKNESGVSGATVYLTDFSGTIRTARTNSFGYYNFADVQVGETYILDVRHKRYQFDTQVVSVLDEMTELNFIASQSPVSKKADSVSAVEDNPVTVSLPTMSVSSKASTVTVPITVGNLTGRNVIAFDFQVSFDPSVLHPVGYAPTSNGGTLSSDFVITANPNIPGRLIVSGYGIYPMSGEGTLLNLNFEVIRQDSSTSPLNWQMFMFNEGDPASTPVNGQITVKCAVRTPRNRIEF